MMARRKGRYKMKTKITKKAIMSAYRNVIKVGYSDMQDALKWREPNFYTFASADENFEIKRK